MLHVRNIYLHLAQIYCKCRHIYKYSIHGAYGIWYHQVVISITYIETNLFSLPETNSLPLKTDGWKMKSRFGIDRKSVV